MNATLLKLLAIGVLIVGSGWWGYNEGESDCQQAHDQAALKAGRDAVKRDTASLDLGKEAAAKAEAAVGKINDDARAAEAEVRVVYRDVVRMQPATCARPLDSRVQAHIDNAISTVNQE